MKEGLILKLDKKKVEYIFAICILTVFTGQIYVNPFFESTLRFSFTVTALSLMLIYFKDIPIILTANTVGISIFFFRCYIYIISNPGVPIGQVIEAYYRGGLFYIFFGVVFKILNIREKIKQPGINVIFLWLCEIIPNFVELLLSREKIHYAFEEAIKIIILVGVTRSIVTVSIYYAISYSMNTYKRKQNENKYRELVCFIASLKTELFFLKKSTVDIENAMNKCFKIYTRLKNTELGNDALSASKDIHEIKKDYVRVLSGIEKTLSEENVILNMSIEDIFNMIRGNTQKLIDLGKKNIDLRFKYDNNFQTKEFYPLISVLNNLIINAIEAIDQTGTVHVIQKIDNEDCIFIVKDNGSGINERDMPLILKPGFSTKFNPATGQMSTGIGLTHVKHLIENHFEGNIDVYSKKGKGTVFTITIPNSKIIYENDHS